MDKEEAREILAAHVARYRAKSYVELATLIGEVQVHEAAGTSGAGYTLEFDVLWDDEPNGDIRVVGGIDDGGLRSAFSPLTDDFLLTPGGEFVGE
jgi:hypothetical protein